MLIDPLGVTPGCKHFRFGVLALEERKKTLCNF